MKHDKALLVNDSVVHTPLQLDDSPRAKLLPNPFLTKSRWKAGAKGHASARSATDLGDDFLGVDQCPRNGFDRHGALADLILGG